MSANPTVQFYFVADRNGELLFEWNDDAGRRGSQRYPLRVAQ